MEGGWGSDNFETVCQNTHFKGIPYSSFMISCIMFVEFLQAAFSNLLP